MITEGSCRLSPADPESKAATTEMLAAPLLESAREGSQQWRQPPFKRLTFQGRELHEEMTGVISMYNVLTNIICIVNHVLVKAKDSTTSDRDVF